MKIAFYILFYFSTALCLAQAKPSAALFATNSEKNNDIMLKWIYSEVYDPVGFDIYRSSGDDNWTKISSSPVTLNKNASVSGFDKETKQLYKAISETPYEEFRTSMARAFVLIRGIYNNDFAKEIGVFYLDKTTSIGQSYKYKITKHNETKVIALSDEIKCSDFDPNFAPQEVNIDRKKKYISINWKPDVYGYYGVDIFKKEIGEADFKKVTVAGPITIDKKTQKNYKPSDIFFVDTAINNEKGYVYKLISINYFGQESNYTPDISVPLKDFVPPSTPYSFKVVPYSLDQYAKLSWNAIEEVDLKGFNIYTGEDPDQQFTKVNTTLLGKDTRTFNVMDLKVGGHYFIISAVDEAGNETTTGMMFGEIRDVIPPDAPQGLTSKAESGTITLSWKPNSENDLWGYIVQKSLSDSNNLDNKYVQVNKELITETNFVINLAKNIQNKFVYRIVAVDTLYNISKPSINSMAQMPDVIAPKTPVISKVSLNEDQTNVLVSWISNVDTDLQGYNLYRKLKGDSTFSKVNFNTIPADVTKYNDRSTNKGNNYVYVVQAVDHSGNVSDNSNEFVFVTKKEKSNAVVEIIKSQYNARKKEIIIQWKWTGEQKPKGFVVYEMSDEGILKPYTGLTETTELKSKITLESKRTFEIRAYATNGEIIKSEIFIIDGSKI